MISYKGCNYCRHNLLFDGTCSAFPQRIPLIIVSGQFKHTEILPGQENTIIYEYIDEPFSDRIKKARTKQHNNH